MRFRPLFCLVLLLSGCASAQSAGDGAANDPFEPVNRAIFTFNTQADKYVMRPVVKGYRFVTTQPVRDGVANFFDNTTEPMNMANQALQGRFKSAGKTVLRFVVNTVAGFFGTHDVAAKMGLYGESTYFGDTLGVWGVPAGPYLILPLLGPSDVRDLTGLGANYFLDPLTYISWRNSRKDLRYYFWGHAGLKALVSYDKSTDLLDDIMNNSLNPYAAMRSMYQQYRAQTVARLSGKPAAQSEDGSGKASFEFSLDELDDE